MNTSSSTARAHSLPNPSSSADTPAPVPERRTFASFFTEDVLALSRQAERMGAVSSQSSVDPMVLNNVAPADVKSPSQRELNLLLSVIDAPAFEHLCARYHFSKRRFGALLSGRIARPELCADDRHALRALLTGRDDAAGQAGAQTSLDVIQYLHRCIETAFGAVCPPAASFASGLERDAQATCDVDGVALVRKLRSLCQPKRLRDAGGAEDAGAPKRCAPDTSGRPTPSSERVIAGKASDPRLQAYRPATPVPTPLAPSVQAWRALDPYLAGAATVGAVLDVPARVLTASTCRLAEQLASECDQPNAKLGSHAAILRAGSDLLAALKSDSLAFATAQQQVNQNQKLQLEEYDKLISTAQQQLAAARTKTQQEQAQLAQREADVERAKRMLGAG